MTEHATPRQIEAKIEQDRASLAQTLDALQDRVSVDTLAQETLGMIRTNFVSYTKIVDDAVRANPLAVTLTGIGLAWLIFGAKKPTPKRVPKPETLSRWEDDGGPVVPVGAIDADWSRESDGLRAKASAALRKVEDDARAAAGGIGQALSGGAGQVRDFAAERAAILADFTASLKGSVRHGLGALSTSAQDRIAAVREAAYSARLAAERVGKGGMPEAARLVEEHPMVVGAVALALGAALGSALPRTQTEDRSFGAERDRLMDVAAKLLAEETARAGLLAGDLGAEISTAFRDVAGAVGDAVANTAIAATDRMTDRVAAEISDPEEPASDPRTKGQNGADKRA